MFTGLIQTLGRLTGRTARGAGARLYVAGLFSGSAVGGKGLVLGESISVSGVCLTVDAITQDGFEADASAETLTKTTLGALALSSSLNLERALRLEDRLGGHIVSGHIDGVGELATRETMGDAENLVFRAPRDLMRFIAPKGSIAVDGISLTVNDIAFDTFSVTIIPRTQRETNVGSLAPKTPVNLEIDLLARYVLRAMEVGSSSSKDASLLELLRKNGYV